MPIGVMNTETIQKESEKQPTGAVILEAKKLVEKIGLDWNNLSAKVKERFEKMNLWGHLEDSEKMGELAKKILEDTAVISLFTEKNTPEKTLQDIMQGSTLSDIGKSGPEKATPEQSEFIIRIFKKNNIENPERTTLVDFVSDKLADFKTPEERARILQSLEPYGINPNMNMRSFHNLHTKWSLEILNTEPAISKKVRDIVAHHHILDKIKEDDGRLTTEDKIVILLDKYDACRNRGKKNHQEAIVWIKNKIQNSEFKDDEEFELLLKVLENVAPGVEAYK